MIPTGWTPRPAQRATFDEFPLGPGFNLNEALDASNECRHGNLPFDPPPNCSCWVGVRRVAPVVELPVKRRVRKAA